MRRFLCLSATLILVLAGSVVAYPAHAAVVDLTCAATDLVSYDPPLTRSPHDSTVTNDIDYEPCASPTHPQITSGGRTAWFPVFDRSCLELLNPGTVTTTTTWNTGQTSTFTTSYTTTLVGAVFTVTITGTVSAGLFEGASVMLIYTGPSLDITLCLLGLGDVAEIQTVGTLVLTG